MTISGSVTGGRDAAENLRSDRYADFATYLVDVNEHFRSAFGVQFRTLSPVNEPSADYWTFGNRQEGNRVYPDHQARIIGLVHDELHRRGSATAVSGSEETSLDVGRDTVRGWSATTMAQLAQLNVHSYSGSDRTGFKNAAAGTKIWDSEHGNGDASGMTLAQHILADVKWLGASAFVYWQAVDSGGWGMLDTELNTAGSDLSRYTQNKKFWAMAQWSRFIRPGYQVMAVSDDDTVAFYDAAGQRVVMVTVNNSTSDRSVTYDLTRFATVDDVSATGHCTDPERDLAPLSPQRLAGNHLAASSPAQSVTTWVVPSMTPR